MRTRAQNAHYRELKQKGYDSETAFILSSENPLATEERLNQVKKKIETGDWEE